MHSTRELLKRLYRRWLQRKARLERKEIAAILARPDEPHHYDSEEGFARLQDTYEPRLEYRYDPYSTWQRGAERALGLLQNAEVRPQGRRVLEAACGDGMVGYLLHTYGHLVTLGDLRDWRDERARPLPMVIGDLCKGLAMDSNSFDLVCSFNSFEHVENPDLAFSEVLRVSKEGGLVYLEFGPLYASPWGLHAYRTIHMPYAQYIYSELFLRSKLSELGINDLGGEQTSLQPLNRWRLEEFEQLWKDRACDILSYQRGTDYGHLAMIKRLPRAFTGRGLTFEDVSVNRISLLLRKLKSKAD